MHLAILLSSLLDLLSTVSKLCEGFIADRFQSTIFPHMAKLLETLVCQKCRKSLFSKEDELMLKSLLNCIHRVFSTNELQLALMVPAVGSIILPFLGVDGNIGENALDAMKVLVKIDSGTLMRALFRASGMDIPPRPLLPMTNQSNHSISVKVTPTSLSRRCLEIVHFVQALPEQNIMD